MAGFKQGALQIGKKDNGPIADQNQIVIAVDTNNNLYTIDEFGIKRYLSASGGSNLYISGTDLNLYTSGLNQYLSLNPTGITSGTYGGFNVIGAFVVDKNGRLVSATNIPISAAGLGTVTSIGISSNSLSISNTPITTSGNILVNLSAIDSSGTFTKGVYDNYGRLISGGNVSTSDITDRSTDGTFSSNSDNKIPTEKAIKTYVDTERKNISTGISDSINYDIVDNGDGTATVPSVHVKLFSTTDFTGNLEEYYVTGTTLTGFVDGMEQYICVSYNGGSPIYYVENNKTNINESNISLTNIVWRQGNTLHSIARDSKGIGLANKIESYVLQTTPYLISVDGGLMLNETTSPNYRTITVTSAIVYSGIVKTSILSFNSSTDKLTLYYHNSGVWNYSSATYYNNTQYDDGTNLQTIPNNKYAVRWFYRTIGDVKETFYVLGTNYYNNIVAAQLETPRTDLPIVIKHHGYLIGRTIIQYNANSGLVENVSNLSFNGTTIPNHNDLGGLQGGDSNSNYYHLSATTYNYLSSLSGSAQSQINYISASVNNINPTGKYLPLSGGTLTGNLIGPSVSSTNITANDITLLNNSSIHGVMGTYHNWNISGSGDMYVGNVIFKFGPGINDHWILRNDDGAGNIYNVFDATGSSLTISQPTTITKDITFNPDNSAYFMKTFGNQVFIRNIVGEPYVGLSATNGLLKIYGEQGTGLKANLDIENNLYSTSFIKKNGTNQQYLMADGSVSYSDGLSNKYLPLSGGTLTGNLNLSGNAIGLETTYGAAIGYINTNGQFFTDTNSGDLAIRGKTGVMRFGFGSGSTASSLQLSNTDLTVGVNSTFLGQEIIKVNGSGSASGVLLSGTGIGYGWKVSDQGTDGKYWDVLAVGNTLSFRSVNDANTVGNSWLQVGRSGATVSALTIAPNTTFNSNVSGVGGYFGTGNNIQNLTSNVLLIANSTDYTVILSQTTNSSLGAGFVCQSPTNSNGSWYAHKRDNTYYGHGVGAYVIEDHSNSTFNAALWINPTSTGQIYLNRPTYVNNNLTANSFIKLGGTSGQFLKADGSVDSNLYLPMNGNVIGNFGDATNPGWNYRHIATININASYDSHTIKYSNSFFNQQFSVNVDIHIECERASGNDAATLTCIGQLNLFSFFYYIDSVNHKIELYAFKAAGNSFQTCIMSIIQSTNPSLVVLDVSSPKVDTPPSAVTELNYIGLGPNYISTNNDLHSTKFIKSGGVSTQYLMADGSVSYSDGLSNTYLPLSGGTLTGQEIIKVNGGGSASGILLSGTGVGYGWKVSDQGTDGKYWDTIAIGNTLSFRSVNDANTIGNSWLQVGRSGAIVSALTIAPNTTFNANVSGVGGYFGAGNGIQNLTSNVPVIANSTSYTVILSQTTNNSQGAGFMCQTPTNSNGNWYTHKRDNTNYGSGTGAYVIEDYSNSTFNAALWINPTSTGQIYLNRPTYVNNNLTANSFVKNGGTNQQYLMADGSVSFGSNLSNLYLPLSGGTLTGQLTFSNNNGMYGIMASNDYWSIFGTGNSDAGKVIFEFGDNIDDHWIVQNKEYTGTIRNVFDATGTSLLVTPPTTFLGQEIIKVNGGGSASGILLSGTGVGYGWNVSDQGTDGKYWDTIAIGNTLSFRSVNDANTGANTWLKVTRSGITATNIDIGYTRATTGFGYGPNITFNSPVIFNPDNYTNFMKTAGNSLYIRSDVGVPYVCLSANYDNVNLQTNLCVYGENPNALANLKVQNDIYSGNMYMDGGVWATRFGSVSRNVLILNNTGAGSLYDLNVENGIYYTTAVDNVSTGVFPPGYVYYVLQNNSTGIIPNDPVMSKSIFIQCDISNVTTYIKPPSGITVYYFDDTGAKRSMSSSIAHGLNLPVNCVMQLVGISSSAYCVIGNWVQAT